MPETDPNTSTRASASARPGSPALARTVPYRLPSALTTASPAADTAPITDPAADTSTLPPFGRVWTVPTRLPQVSTRTWVNPVTVAVTSPKAVTFTPPIWVAMSSLTFPYTTAVMLAVSAVTGASRSPVTSRNTSSPSSDATRPVRLPMTWAWMSNLARSSASTFPHDLRAMFVPAVAVP